MELWFWRYETDTKPKQPSARKRDWARSRAPESLRLSLLSGGLRLGPQPQPLLHLLRPHQQAARFARNGMDDFVCDNLCPQSQNQNLHHNWNLNSTLCQCWLRVCGNLGLSVLVSACFCGSVRLCAAIATKTFCHRSCPVPTVLALTSLSWCHHAVPCGFKLLTITPLGPDGGRQEKKALFV